MEPTCSTWIVRACGKRQDVVAIPCGERMVCEKERIPLQPYMHVGLQRNPSNSLNSFPSHGDCSTPNCNGMCLLQSVAAPLHAWSFCGLLSHTFLYHWSQTALLRPQTLQTLRQTLQPREEFYLWRYRYRHPQTPEEAFLTTETQSANQASNWGYQLTKPSDSPLVMTAPRRRWRWRWFPCTRPVRPVPCTFKSG